MDWQDADRSWHIWHFAWIIISMDLTDIINLYISFYNDSYYQSFPSNIVKALTMNVETLSGRAELAQLLQSLQQTLKNI